MEVCHSMMHGKNGPLILLEVHPEGATIQTKGGSLSLHNTYREGLKCDYETYDVKLDLLDSPQDQADRLPLDILAFDNIKT